FKNPCSSEEFEMAIAAITLPRLLTLGGVVALVAAVGAWGRQMLMPCRHCSHTRFSHSPAGCHSCHSEAAVHTYESKESRWVRSLRRQTKDESLPRGCTVRRCPCTNLSWHETISTGMPALQVGGDSPVSAQRPHGPPPLASPPRPPLPLPPMR